MSSWASKSIELTPSLGFASQSVTPCQEIMAARFPPEPLNAIAEEVASLLLSRNETISVAETAAGGLISAALLSTPGASALSKGGVTVCGSRAARIFVFAYLLYFPFVSVQAPPPSRSQSVREMPTLVSADIHARVSDRPRRLDAGQYRQLRRPDARGHVRAGREREEEAGEHILCVRCVE
jgi:hypothetical protein